MIHPSIHIGKPKDFQEDCVAVYWTEKNKIKGCKINFCSKDYTPEGLIHSLNHEYLHHILYHFINKTACKQLDELTDYGRKEI